MVRVFVLFVLVLWIGISASAQSLPGLESSMDEVWVEFDNTGAESGSAVEPFNTIYEAIHAVVEGGTIRVDTGITRVTPQLSKPMTIVSNGGTVRIGVSSNDVTWPLSGGLDEIGPLSSTFGPRLKASENFRYDYHRGIDIPASLGTDVRAIADGVVRIAGDHPSYSDLIVQLTHDDGAGGTYYSNSIHLSAVSVAVDDVVLRGDVIGQTGVGDSGFPHLHFETRREGLNQRNCVSPFLYLPYADDRTPPQLAINSINTSTSASPVVRLTVVVPRDDATDALDFNSVTVSTWRDNGSTVTKLDEHTFDMNAWNFAYTPLPPADANVNLDHEDFNGVLVEPAEFTTSSQLYEITFTFYDLAGPIDASELVVTAVAKDLLGHTVEVRQ